MDIKIDSKFDKKLKELAAAKGFIGTRGPSVTSLMEAIAVGEVPLGYRQYLLDATWLPEIQEYISLKQPFTINYQDARGDSFTFNATYAQIVWREKRNYLEIYDPHLLENYSTNNIEGLKHNRCLRFDRIQRDAGISELDLPWREEGLETVEVVFDLFAGLANSYSEKVGDRDKLISVPPTDRNQKTTQKRRVWRQIDNDFWFLKSIKSYGDKAKIISPNILVEKYKQELQNALDLYS